MVLDEENNKEDEEEDEDEDNDDDDNDEDDDNDGDDEDDVVFCCDLRTQSYLAHRGLPRSHWCPATAGSFTLRHRGCTEIPPPRTIHCKANG